MAEKAQLESKLTRLQAKRENVFRRVQLCYEAGLALEREPSNLNKIRNFNVRYSTLPKSIEEHEQIVGDIIETKQKLDPEVSPDYGIKDAFDDLYSHIEYFAASLLKTTQPPQVTQERAGQLYMPKIELVKFNGEDLALWPLFHENFKHFVHTKAELSKAEKLQYLLGSLAGKALKACSSIEAIPSNYDIIWKLLEDTYNDKKYLFTLYFDRILNFRSLTNHTPSNLQNFLENFDINVAALQRLKLKDLDKHMLTHIALSKLPQETINSFELIRSSNELPGYEELTKFLRQQSRIVMKNEKSRSSSLTNIQKPSSSFAKNTKTFFADANNSKSKGNNPSNSFSNCVACNESPHLLKDCKFFQECSHEKRFRIVKERNLCLNCFSSKHRVNSCPSKFSCVRCKLRHHTLLCRNGNETSNISPSVKVESSSSTPSPSACCSQITQNNIQACCTTISSELDTIKERNHLVLLGTALVKVADRWGFEHQIRFLIDSGSMSNLVTADCCRRLGLTFSKFPSNIVGIGGSIKPVKGKTSLIITSNYKNNKNIPIEALIVEKITNFLPDSPIDTEPLEHLKNLSLADPTFGSPGKVDGILGASVFSEILLPNRVKGLSGTPTALETEFGYMIIGQVKNCLNQRTFCAVLSLESLVEKMFEVEDYPISKECNDEEICEQLFIENVSRDDSGRYTVALPFKDDPSILGDSFEFAKSRLFSLEKRLARVPELRKTYSAIFKEYIDKGYMYSTKQEIVELPSYYIPHHCIFKESVSTPCRIVFDASMKTTSGISLNDILHKGPKLQSNPVDILLKFRLFPIAIVSDLKKMYLQVRLVESHIQYQRILWRFNESDPISVFQLNTLSFGVKSSPFLSLRVVKQLCKDESERFPEAAKYASSDMYMDDFISSLPNVQDAIKVQSQLIELFKSGGFEITKWMSNSKKLLNNISEDAKLVNTKEFDQNSLRVLGLEWKANSDKFSFKTNIEFSQCTKRNMLSLVARTFDPLGFVSPVTLLIKLLIKKLWEIHSEWDEIAPREIQNIWDKIQREFNQLNLINVPRHILVFQTTHLSLVGFSDASTAGYAIVVYARTVDMSGKVNVTFLCSQSRVAPMSKITLPKLELSAATLLAKRLSHIKEVYSDRKTVTSIFALSDSMITLHWINSPIVKLQSFVSNRISIIQKCLPQSNWYFVCGKENVSDCASRGLTPSNLMNHNTWFGGPSWLLANPEEWPVKRIDPQDHPPFDSENISLVISPDIVSPLYSIINYFSSWTKMLNSTVYVLRFLKILPMASSIQSVDLEKAERFLMQAVQKKHFTDEYKFLKTNRQPKSPIRRLNPFIKNGVIRVGGRLSNSNMSFEFKHPILLPKCDPLVNILIDHNHKKYHHTGAYLLQSLLRQRYWILSGRNVIRRRIWKCNYCFKLNPKPQFPMMADLPTARVNQAKAFLHTGVDYTGSFPITISRYRGVKTQKAYVCLFICLSTKAVHLELAPSLSTESFLNAFKRFVSRRGNCSTLYSDCGTNFVGAKRYLEELHQLFTSKEYQDSFQHEFNSLAINWKLNAPSAPHFGGIWESNIKSCKRHLARVIGTQILTYDEFTTVLSQIESLMNSRPLCNLSNDPNDPVALTPAHFLYGCPLGSLPSEGVALESIKSLNRFKLLDQIVQQYWNRWHVEYLSTLQSRQKWNSPENPAKLGMVVIIIYENIPSLQWPLAVIERLLPGKDGIVRVVQVKTKHGLFTRPVAKLCPLPTQ